MKSLIIFVFSAVLNLVLLSNLYSEELIAHWSFDDSTAKDISGHHLDGIIVNHPTFVDGIKGKAIRFQGRGYYQPTYYCDNSALGDHVLLPCIDLGIYPEFTISMWVKEEGFSSPGGEGYIWFGHFQNGWMGLLNHIYDSQALQLHCTVGSIEYNTEIRKLYDMKLQNEWVRYIIVYKNNSIKLYINNQMIEEQKNVYINYQQDSAALGRHWWYYDEERTSARFTGCFDEVKIYKRALPDSEIVVKTDPCVYSFNYKNFLIDNNINYVGNSSRIDSTIRLTNNKILQNGSIWLKNKLSLLSDFTTNFSFKITDGNNGIAPDNSTPGADGIAFVMQTDNDHALGYPGGGIGYEGLKNAIAIEFDTFNNDSNQIENYFDPNGNHAAVQICKNGFLNAKHNSGSTININKNIINFKNDGTVYYCKIEYDYKNKNLKVYLNDKNSFNQPIFDIPSFDIQSYLNSDWAYLGFTSATGNAFEAHSLLSWDYCSQAKPITAINNEQDNSENIFLNVFPNPVSNHQNININITAFNNDPVSLYLINPMTGTEKEILTNYQFNEGQYNISFDCQNLTSGVYFIKYQSCSKILIKKIIIFD